MAAEAGFAPAALYGYFRGKDDLLLALAAEDLSQLARAMPRCGNGPVGRGQRGLALLGDTSKLSPGGLGGLAACEGGNGEEAERLFQWPDDRGAQSLVGSRQPRLPKAARNQCDVVLLAAALSGLALLARSGRLGALGFRPDEILARLDSRVSAQRP